MSPRTWSSDRGAGTVLLLGVVAAALVVAGGLGLLGAAQAARWRAQTAADLAALAGAAAARAGTADVCGTADEVVARNGATTVACVREGDGVVRVEASSRGVWGDARAVARAGPRS